MNTNNHLSEESIAIAAEAMATNTYDKVDVNIKKHIAECDDCAHEVQFVSELSENHEEQTKIIDLRRANKSKRNPMFWVAASISIAVVASTVFIWIQNDNLSKEILLVSELETMDEKVFTQETIDSLETVQDIRTVTEISEPIQVETSKVLLAYQAHPDMEALVNRFADDSSHRGFGVEVSSPIEIKQKDKTVTLEWENEESSNITLEVFDNEANKLFEIETTENAYQINQLEKSGLYYWKLLDEEFELVFCGKIILE